MPHLCDCDRLDHIDSPDGHRRNLSIAAEHVETLPANERAQLRAREAAGEIRIRPRAEMIPEPLREIRVLRAARMHMRDEDET